MGGKRPLVIMGDLLASLKKQLRLLMKVPDEGLWGMANRLDNEVYAGLLTQLTSVWEDRDTEFHVAERRPLHRQMFRALEWLEEQRHPVAHVKDTFGAPDLTTINSLTIDELKQAVRCDDLSEDALKDLDELIDALGIVRAYTKLPWICDLKGR